jgi:hypothetical protein
MYKTQKTNKKTTKRKRKQKQKTKMSLSFCNIEVRANFFGAILGNLLLLILIYRHSRSLVEHQFLRLGAALPQHSPQFC